MAVLFNFLEIVTVGEGWEKRDKITKQCVPLLENKLSDWQKREKKCICLKQGGEIKVGGGPSISKLMVLLTWFLTGLSASQFNYHV